MTYTTPYKHDEEERKALEAYAKDYGKMTLEQAVQRNMRHQLIRLGYIEPSITDKRLGLRKR
jgi:hypothetical protein